MKAKRYFQNGEAAGAWLGGMLGALLGYLFAGIASGLVMGARILKGGRGKLDLCKVAQSKPAPAERSGNTIEIDSEIVDTAIRAMRKLGCSGPEARRKVYDAIGNGANTVEEIVNAAVKL